MSGGLVLQGPWRPTAVLTALEALATQELSELRISVAYTTLGGCAELMPRLADRVGTERWLEIPKTIVTSTDFGLTEPNALKYLHDEQGFEVRLSDMPPSFHPKLYAFGRGSRFHAFVGSANLTKAALTSNGEAGTVISMRAGGAAGFDADWATLLAASSALTDEGLAGYRERRKSKPPSLPPETRVRAAEKAKANDLAPLLKAIGEDRVDPASFEAMWVEAGSMPSSGSHNQLELPRGGNLFFSFSFDSYDGKRRPIGKALLKAGGEEWDDRKLVWHGENRMERIYLPTKDKGGFVYPQTAVLFTRLGSGFQLTVASWEGKVAASWRAASRAIGREYRLGPKSNRTCGLF